MAIAVSTALFVTDRSLSKELSRMATRSVKMTLVALSSAMSSWSFLYRSDAEVPEVRQILEKRVNRFCYS